jgi:dihydrofolate reductase
MIVISAMSRDRLIGKGDGLPWHVPEEYDQFLRFIAGQTVILGRKSYPIYGKTLTSAHNVVVSRSVAELPNAVVAPGIEEALVYEQTIPLADAMYLSYMKGDFQGDAYFPEFDASLWNVERREDHPEFEFVVYRRAV